MSALYFTPVVSFFFLFCSSYNQWNSSELCHVLGSERDLKAHVQNLGCISPKNWGPKAPVFDFFRFRNLLTNLMANVFDRKHDGENLERHWKLQRVLYSDSKFHELWSSNGSKQDLHFCPPSVNTALCFFASLCKQMPSNANQPNFARRQG